MFSSRSLKRWQDIFPLASSSQVWDLHHGFWVKSQYWKTSVLKASCSAAPGACPQEEAGPCNGCGKPICLAKASRQNHIPLCSRQLVKHSPGHIFSKGSVCTRDTLQTMFLTTASTASAPAMLWALLQLPRSSATLSVGTGCTQDRLLSKARWGRMTSVTHGSQHLALF